MNRVVLFLCAIAGVREDAAARAPKALAQAATLGLLLVLTASVAAVTAGYALHRAFVGDAFAIQVAAVGGIVWGGIVFAIDRLMILGLDKFAAPRHLLLQVLVRIPLAVIIGLVMSKPVLLRVSQTVLDAELREERREKIMTEKATNVRVEGLAEKHQSVYQLEQAQQSQEERLRGEPDSAEWRTARDAFQRAEARYQSVSSANSRLIATARQEIATEVGRSAQNPARIEALRQQIADWQRQIAQAASAARTAQKCMDTALANWLRAETERLNAVNSELAEAKKDESATAARVLGRDAESELALESLMRPNLVNQFAILKRIQADSKNPDSTTLWVFELALDMFFAILEMTPVILKVLSRKGPLDYATVAVEFEDQERINLSTNSTVGRLQKAAEVALAVENEALELWRDTHLKRLKQKGSLTIAEVEQLHEETKQMPV